jgi:hypothetical protein
MASIVLGVAGGAAGGAIGGPVGAVIGAQIGRSVGSSIDGAILSKNKTLRPLNGPRLADLGVQSSTYGKMIPIVYGLMRVGGNIIWSQPMKETITSTTSSAGGGGKGGGGKISQTTTNYTYSITLAIAICEGPLDQIMRIWADAKQLDLSQYTVRLYNGDESQLPDTLIQSIEGVNNTPAFRGLAYVVFEDFQLGDYGNRIPNFTFEVIKKKLSNDYSTSKIEDMITGMVMIPGAGEFVYDTVIQNKVPGALVGGNWVQQGSQQSVNMHTAYGKANALAALDQLKQTCPNVNWVSVVISWFGTSMTLSACDVLPGVEYQTGAITAPNLWSSGGFNRSTAHPITLISGSPQYGGTPDDGSILRYLTELRARGYNIAFYPLLFMDVAGKPWRGDLTGSASDINTFFTKTNGFKAYITHYANLVAAHVDAFVIGSEMKGLTKVTDIPGNYPAVNQFVSLAATVKSIMGSGVKVTYAADWSEYHHAEGGWYNLDPLWASPNIDVIGIDAYFPLTDAVQTGYDVNTVIAGWTSGEGYDWYYSDPARTMQVPLAAPYAWKNIAWFWNNTHTNPNGATTAWTPAMKKIWFTEVGFPSVDGATNQPNVFYDPLSTQSGIPYKSRGRVDFLAQRIGLAATHAQWAGSSMIERIFVWAWDARPFPYWPDLNAVWSDGVNWQTGHWVQGKLGTSGLDAILSDICARSGLTASDIDVSAISGQVDGFIINRQQTMRDAIETLQSAYFFDAVESGDVLKFVPRGGASVLTINEDDIAVGNNELFSVNRAQEIELPKRINIIYLSRLLNYQTATQHSQREVTSSMEILTMDIPIVCTDQMAKTIADIALFSQWTGRTAFQFNLPLKYAQLEPTDIITVTVSGITYRMRVASTRMVSPTMIEVKALMDDQSTYDFYSAPATPSSLLLENQSVATSSMSLLDMPAFPGDDNDKGVIRVAANGLSGTWTGAALYRSDDGGANYGRVIDLSTPSVIGTSVTALAVGPTAVFDDANSVTVSLIGSNALQSVSELAVLNGANAALIGNEIIQFKTATLINANQYRLSGLLRGRLGTDWAIAGHVAGEAFVLLDGRVNKFQAANNLIGLSRSYKCVSFGSTLTATSPQDFLYTGVALKPYSPVHLSGVRDGSGNLTINWVRRTRISGNWQDGVDVALNETSEAYEVEIMNGVNVMRTITGLSTPTASYTAAQQITDFGAAQTSVSVRIYQLSSLVGRGYSAVAAV